MFRCPKCRKTVFRAECNECGCNYDEALEIASSFVEYLRTGRLEGKQYEPPKPFRHRLAKFAQCDESEVMLDVPVYSNMPLCIFGPVGPYVGAKSISMIRAILLRIRRTVRGSS